MQINSLIIKYTITTLNVSLKDSKGDNQNADAKEKNNHVENNMKDLRHQNTLSSYTWR